MTTLPRIGLLLAGILLGSGARLSAQTFDLGSNGSYGAMNITASTTLQVPPDGVFHCTTISITSSLRFAKNAANTPIYLLATGDVSISSHIYVDGVGSDGIAAGIGGPGGFDGGQGGDNPGDGQGPGAGKWGWVDTSPTYGTKPANQDYRGSAGFAYRPSSPNQINTAGSSYGNSLLMPMIGGSGGGGGKASSLQHAYGGGGGGGAILIASNTRITFSQSGGYFIYARGGSAQSGQHGNGSGGSVRLVAPRVEGSLGLQLPPGQSQNSALWGSYGRARIDSLNIGNLTVSDEGGPSPKSRDFVTYGSNMTVFPPNFPGLRITQVGTQVIPGTQVAPVFVLFPAGSPATQTVTVSCTNFNSTVPLRAVVTPQSGSTQTFDFTVDNTAGGTTTGSVDVQIPAGVASRVDVWTR